MKPTRDCGRQEIMLRALIVLDGLTMLTDGLMCQNPKTPEEHFANDVYSIAHAAHGKCCAGGGTSWLDKIDERAELLKTAGILDLEKVLADATAKQNGSKECAKVETTDG